MSYSSERSISIIPMITLSNILLVITATTTALIAGLFFAWSCSVTIGLARVTDIVYITAMQSMNRAILNPVFLSCFLGTAILLPLSTYIQYSPATLSRFWFLLAASVVYIIGVLGVTMAGNVPLNESLDVFALSSASASEISLQRAAFEGKWNFLNTIRTIASALSIILVIIACLAPARPESQL